MYTQPMSIVTVDKSCLLSSDLVIFHPLEIRRIRAVVIVYEIVATVTIAIIKYLLEIGSFHGQSLTYNA